jgi:hypothetical protein
MAQHRITEATMYCRKCGYQLAGLSANRCPECGQTFDPANRRTYLQHPKGSSRRWWLRVAGIALLVLLALVATGMYGTHAWLRWRWRSQQAAMVALQARGWRVQVRPRTFRAPGGRAGAYLANWFIIDTSYMLDSVAVDWVPPLNAHFHSEAERPGDADLAILDGLPLETSLRLYLSPSTVTDVGLRHLQGRSGLTSLRVEGSAITDAGLKYLSGLQGLRDLSLANTRITDLGLSHLQGLPNLQDLSLWGTPITDTGLGYIAKLPRLESLDLWGTRITPAGMAQLRNSSRLKVLRHVPEGMTDEVIAHLKRLPRLQKLSLDRSRITDAGMADLGQMTGLKDLSIESPDIGDEGLAHLEGLTNLETLSLRSPRISDR